VRLIFSRDRAAQLDLLLSSLEANAGPGFTIVIWRASDERGLSDFRAGYQLLFEREREGVHGWEQGGDGEFEGMVRTALDLAGERTLLLCDDDVLYRPWKEWVYWPESLLCFSLRMGVNCASQYPTGATQAYPGAFYHWPSQAENGDFGYPGSLDGHQFRTDDLRRMLQGRTFPNPTALECALVEGCNELASERPMLSVYSEQRLVGLPLNRVSEQSNVRHGERSEYGAPALNERFLAGDRLDLSAIDFSQVSGAHHELELCWRLAQERVGV
jgi:hypothetical protein